ncbi:hypothetical protein CK203_098899 [Vitis vinifera]|uniref:Disease resistance N-terminal domain-containing protein n=1 Tax=Vitis vinifera TaxID=29760 RepID=A0A438CJR9_VITVI|nr:hypothetical protein CK203_098899 [Vitis vinifera]
MNKFSLVPGVESEIQSLKNTLRSVRDVLDDAERRKVKEKSVQGWLERLKDMAYEMMDVLDEWSIALFQFQMEGVASTSKTKVSFCMPSLSSVSSKLQVNGPILILSLVGVRSDHSDL